MRENYITAGFRAEVSRRFPGRAPELERAYQARLDALRTEHAGDSKEKRFHLERQILPGIATYETLQSVLPKEEALRAVHTCTADNARRKRKSLDRLMRLPGLYRLVPGIFRAMTRRLFGSAAGFSAVERQVHGGIWRIDMTRCPYHDTCVQHGCPELCVCFCDSDDIAYDGLHPHLLWRRTKTLGRGDACCDFCLMVTDGGTEGRT